MAKISETELRRKLKKLEVDSSAGGGASIEKVGDQYEYDKTVIYLAYASALSNLSSGTIPSQSDATDFQFSPYNDSGVLLAYRGYFINKSIYQSGDPTDYTWESTSGASGFTSSERYYTIATGLIDTLGNPTKPGTDIDWAVITAGTAVPGTAVYLAERFTLTTSSGAVTSNWDIKPVGKHVDTSVVSASGIKATNMDLDGTLNVTADSGAVRWGKDDGDDIVNSGLFIGRNASGSPKFIIGSASSFIYFDGATGIVSAVGVSESPDTGESERFYTDTSTTHIFDVSPLLDEINIQMVGGGGGGCKVSYVDGGPPGTVATNGGASVVVVKNSSGGTRATYTAAGGAMGSPNCSGGGSSAGTADGSPGGTFSHPGGGAHADFAGTGGAGQASGGSAGSGGTGAGGGGMRKVGGSGSAGAGGGAATFYTVTLTTAGGTFASTDKLHITVGTAGAGRVTTRDGAAGSGGAGLVRIKGELA